MEYIKSMPCGNNTRLARWSLALQRLNYKICYIKGEKRSHVDSLSRVDWKSLDIRPNMTLEEFQKVVGKHDSHYQNKRVTKTTDNKRGKTSVDRSDDPSDLNVNTSRSQPTHTISETRRDIDTTWNLVRQSDVRPDNITAKVTKDTGNQTAIALNMSQAEANSDSDRSQDNMTARGIPMKFMTARSLYTRVNAITRRMAKKLVSGKRL